MLACFLCFSSRLCGCILPCGLNFIFCNLCNWLNWILCPSCCPRRSGGGCCCLRRSSSKVCSITDNLEEVTDCTTFYALQQFLDQTFRDRPYSGQYTPRHLMVKEAYRVRNDTAQKAYIQVRETLRKTAAGASSLTDGVLTGWELPVALRQDLEIWGLDEPLDPAIDEHLFFHGTNEGAAKGIVEGDFRLPPSHEHGGSYGKGVYLAESSTKAHMYSKPRGGDNLCPILVVRSALGTVHNTNLETPNPGGLESGASSGQYNSVCGDRRKLTQNYSGYREFIVYDTGQVLPMYLLWCSQRTACAPCLRRSCRC